MRQYELILVVQPDLDDEAKQGVIERVQTMITENGGKVEKTEVWGSKQLAYEIQDFREGHYVYMEVAFDPKFGAELNQSLKYIEPIIRHSLIKNDE